MLSIITAGLTIGILGSFHCIGMCGPLALSLPVNDKSSFIKFLATFVYNAGRVITYALLGLLFGLIGHSIALFGFQQLLSILIGFLILLFLCFGNRFSTGRINIPFFNRLVTLLRKYLGELYRNRNFSSVFLIGLLNGLLPCGLVYMAIAGALATGELISSIIFMAAFGLGTLPVMWAIAFYGNMIPAAFRIKIRTIYPYLLGLMACMLILRGMGLGIPYVSPRLITTQTSAKECSPAH